MERWQQIEALFEQARAALDPEKRAQVLAAADPELRREVEALLAQKDHAGESTMTMVGIGTLLGRYEIEAPLGKGGMGEVFRARDTRLGRSVAIKVSNSQFSERFEREARAISALNHPHICTLHDVGPNYLVMELVEGETLAARLKKGALAIEQVLQYGVQIADALAAAHAKEITHRDLKPGNIMLSKTAGVKVLDFGLAKMQSSAGEALTKSNVVMGTPAYMAPEQFQGEEADARSDIYSLGLVLYEMAAGKRAMQGQMPPLDPLPEKLAHVIERCLASDPKERWQAAADVQRELKWAGTARAVVPALSRNGSRAWWGWGVAGVACVTLAALLLRAPASPPETRTARFQLADTRAGVKIIGLPKPAPDGSAVVYSAADSQGRQLLWLRSLDSEDTAPLAGTDDPLSPVWSPDGKWIAFYSQGRLKKVSRDGATVQSIATLASFDSAAWGKGEIVLTLGNRTPLYRIPDSGGTPQQITRLDASRTENSHREIVFLPDGRRFFFIARCGTRENNTLYEGSLDSANVRRVARMDSNVAYVPPSAGRGAKLLFARDGKLFQQTYDGTSLKGDVVPVMDVQYNAVSLHGDFSLSADGRVLSIRPRFETASRLTWMDRMGKAAGTLGAPGNFEEPAISRDGKIVLFNRPDDNGGNRDLWMIDAARNIASRLTVTPANEWGNRWGPDGKGILFASDRSGNTGGSMFQKVSMDPGSGEAAMPGLPNFANPTDSSTDGRWIAFVNGTTHNDIWIASADGSSAPFRFLETPFQERDPAFSRDTRWIAYQSNESGRFEIYVRPFAGKKADDKGKVRVSERGGFYPVWSHDGNELFFIGPDSMLYVAPVAALGRGGSLPSPRPLFEVCPGNTPNGQATQGRAYDVAPDGRFLFVCGNSAQNHYSLFLNWNPK